MLLFFSISLFVGEERGLVFVLEVTAAVEVVLLDSFRLSQWFQATVEHDPINKTNI